MIFIKYMQKMLVTLFSLHAFFIFSLIRIEGSWPKFFESVIRSTIENRLKMQILICKDR